MGKYRQQMGYVSILLPYPSPFYRDPASDLFWEDTVRRSPLRSRGTDVPRGPTQRVPQLSLLRVGVETNDDVTWSTLRVVPVRCGAVLPATW